MRSTILLRGMVFFFDLRTLSRIIAPRATIPEASKTAFIIVNIN